jgi:hypothetical protein
MRELCDEGDNEVIMVICGYQTPSDEFAERVYYYLESKQPGLGMRFVLDYQYNYEMQWKINFNRAAIEIKSFLKEFVREMTVR